MKLTILIIGTINMWLTAFNASSDLCEKDIALFKARLEIFVMDHQGSDESVMGSSYDVMFVPPCYIDPRLYVSGNELRDQLRIDSLSGFTILRSRNQDRKIILRGGINSNISTSMSISTSDLLDIKMIDFVYQNYSKNPFFTTFSGLDTNKIVGFFEGDKIHFLNRKMEIVPDFREVIRRDFGSLEKYSEIMTQERSKLNLAKSISTPETAKTFLRNHYVANMNSLPSDTLKNLDLLLSRISKAGDLTLNQRNLIGSQIILQWKKHYLLPFSSSGIPFYDRDIAPCIRSVLTTRQYEEVYEQLVMDSWLANQASNKIYNYLRIERKIPQDQMDKAYLEWVFK